MVFLPFQPPSSHHLPLPHLGDGIRDCRLTYIFYSFIKSSNDQVTLLITREQNAWKKPFITMKGPLVRAPSNMRAVWQEALSTNANALLPLMPGDLLTSISGAGWRRGQTPAPLVCPRRFQWQGIENIMHVKRPPPTEATCLLFFLRSTLNTARRCQLRLRKAHEMNRMREFKK